MQNNSFLSMLIAACLGFSIIGCTGANEPNSNIMPTPKSKAVFAQSNEALYKNNCAMCHDKGSTKAPSRESLALRSPEQLIHVMTKGAMQLQAQGLSIEEKRNLATHLSQTATSITGNINNCSSGSPRRSKITDKEWARWGGDLQNTRFSGSERSNIDSSTISRLKLSWAFGFEGSTAARSQPAVTDNAVFVGSQTGTVYALNRDTGCEWWRYQADAEVRTGIVVGPSKEGSSGILYFGDLKGSIYALDLSSGKEIWKEDISLHRNTTITGTPQLYGSRLYVPVSSQEVISARNPEYACCTFRGSIIAMDAKNGEQIWRRFMVEESTQTGMNRTGKAISYGPSGVPIWSTPTIDEKRRLMYFGTGEHYSEPTTETSDAIVAVHLDTGEIAWIKQLTANDAWNASCGFGEQDNCPDPQGPDWDIGAPPILVQRDNERDLLLVGQKSGLVFALDPSNNGALIWQKRVGRGGYSGGVHWGMTVIRNTLFAPVSDAPSRHPGTVGPPMPGLHALSIDHGSKHWYVSDPSKDCNVASYRCAHSFSAAASASNDTVFAGGLDGIIRAFNAQSGELLWRFDTYKSYKTVNGVQAKGGTLDSGGAVFSGNQMLINSGYDMFGQLPGNVLLVFDIDT